MCLLAKIVWSILTVFIKPKTSNKKNLLRLFQTNLLCFNGNSFETLAKLIVLMRFQKDRVHGRTLRTRQSQVPCLRDTWRGISRETNTPEPPSTAARHLPSLLFCCVGRINRTPFWSRASVRFLVISSVWLLDDRPVLLTQGCSRRPFNVSATLLLSRSVFLHSPRSFRAVKLTWPSWCLADRSASSHLIIRRCCYRNRMDGRIPWGIAAGFTFCSVSSIRVIADVI